MGMARVPDGGRGACPLSPGGESLYSKTTPLLGGVIFANFLLLPVKLKPMKRYNRNLSPLNLLSDGQY